MRKSEYFNKMKLKNNESVSNTPPKLFPQERDWTCAIACIRTMLSGVDNLVPEEDWFIETFQLEPGPHYSKDIKRKKILENYDVKYGCDKLTVVFDDIVDFIRDGYYIMLESMVNYAHWMVMLGYYTNYDSDIEKAKILFYDPYYNEVRLVNADEFIGMWRDGDYSKTNVEKDFIAIRKR